MQELRDEERRQEEEKERLLEKQQVSFIYLFFVQTSFFSLIRARGDDKLDLLVALSSGRG